MKKICIFLLAALSSLAVAAQAVEEPAYKKDPNLPTFSIQQTDSSWFTADAIPKYEYTAIVYFSPTCGHCQFTAKDIVKHTDSLKNVFFVFVSYSPMNEIREFYNAYGLNVFANIRIGRDPKYYVPSFFHVEATPFVAVYDRNHKLVTVFDPPHKPPMEAEDLVNLVNKKLSF